MKTNVSSRVNIWIWIYMERWKLSSRVSVHAAVNFHLKGDTQFKHVHNLDLQLSATARVGLRQMCLLQLDLCSHLALALTSCVLFK